MSFGKILFGIGIAGVLISLALVFCGIVYVNSTGTAGYFWLSIIGFILMGVSLIIIVVGAAGWFLESFADRTRLSKRGTDDLPPDYNIKNDKR